MNDHSFLVLFIVFIALMTLVPMLFKKVAVPSVIALLIVGMITGPNAFDLIGKLASLSAHFGGDPVVVENTFSSLVDALGALGLVFLMTLAGMEADFKLIRSALKPVVALSILTFLLPAVTGFFIFMGFVPDDLPGQLLYASLFASHSVGIVFPVIRELNLSKTKFGAAVLISTVITDVASIILLAVSVQLKNVELGAAAKGGSLSLLEHIDAAALGVYFTPLFLLVVVAYMVFTMLLVKCIGNWVMEKMKGNHDALVTFLLLVVLGAVIVGEMLGINMVVGAFIAGLALAGLMQSHASGSSVFFKFEGIGYGFLIPFLFVSIGMESDFRAFVQPGNLTVILFTIVGLVGSKVLSGWLAMRMSGFSSLKGLCAGLMTVPQLSATLAAASIGKELGILDENFFNAIIVLSIVTTLPIPSLVRFVITRGKLTFDERTCREAYRLPDAEEDDLI